MALSVLAYNLTRAMNIVGIKPLIAAIAASPRTDLLERPILNGQDPKLSSRAAGGCRTSEIGADGT